MQTVSAGSAELAARHLNEAFLFLSSAGLTQRRLPRITKIREKRGRTRGKNDEEAPKNLIKSWKKEGEEKKRSCHEDGVKKMKRTNEMREKKGREESVGTASDRTLVRKPSGSGFRSKYPMAAASRCKGVAQRGLKKSLKKSLNSPLSCELRSVLHIHIAWYKAAARG